MRDADGFFWNGWNRLWMHGHGLRPAFLDGLVLFQYLIFLSDLALAIRQHYLRAVLPVVFFPSFFSVFPPFSPV